MKVSPKFIALFLLVILTGLSSATYFSAPAKPLEKKINYFYFESGKEEVTNSLVRPFCDNEETQVRYSPDIFHDHLCEFHSVISKVLLTDIRQRRNAEVPKEDLYLLHSIFLI